MQWLDLLLFKTWWQYDPRETPWVAIPYHVFNLFEGGCWVIFAGLVLHRRWKNHRLGLELWHALAFFTFGLTDFRVAYALSSWLITLKLANLLTLLALRSAVIRRFYPASKLY